MSEPLRFAFSIRSPYAWIAARRILPRVHPDVPVEQEPLFPHPTFLDFGNLVPGGHDRMAWALDHGFVGAADA